MTNSIPPSSPGQKPSIESQSDKGRPLTTTDERTQSVASSRLSSVSELTTDSSLSPRSTGTDLVRRQLTALNDFVSGSISETDVPDLGEEIKKVSRMGNSRIERLCSAIKNLFLCIFSSDYRNLHRQFNLKWAESSQRKIEVLNQKKEEILNKQTKLHKKAIIEFENNKNELAIIMNECVLFPEEKALSKEEKKQKIHTLSHWISDKKFLENLTNATTAEEWNALWDPIFSVDDSTLPSENAKIRDDLYLGVYILRMLQEIEQEFLDTPTTTIVLGKTGEFGIETSLKEINKNTKKELVNFKNSGQLNPTMAARWSDVSNLLDQKLESLSEEDRNKIGACLATLKLYEKLQASSPGKTTLALKLSIFAPSPFVSSLEEAHKASEKKLKKECPNVQSLLSELRSEEGLNIPILDELKKPCSEQEKTPFVETNKFTSDLLNSFIENDLHVDAFEIWINNEWLEHSNEKDKIEKANNLPQFTQSGDLKTKLENALQNLSAGEETTLGYTTDESQSEPSHTTIQTNTSSISTAYDLYEKIENLEGQDQRKINLILLMTHPNMLEIHYPTLTPAEKEPTLTIDIQKDTATIQRRSLVFDGTNPIGVGTLQITLTFSGEEATIKAKLLQDFSRDQKTVQETFQALQAVPPPIL